MSGSISLVHARILLGFCRRQTTKTVCWPRRCATCGARRRSSKGIYICRGDVNLCPEKSTNTNDVIIHVWSGGAQLMRSEVETQFVMYFVLLRTTCRLYTKQIKMLNATRRETKVRLVLIAPDDRADRGFGRVPSWISQFRAIQ